MSAHVSPRQSATHERGASDRTSSPESVEKPQDGDEFGSAKLDPPPTEKADPTVRDDGKEELTEEEVYDQLGTNFSSLRKWTILSVIFAVQVSMVRRSRPNKFPRLTAHGS